MRILVRPMEELLMGGNFKRVVIRDTSVMALAFNAPLFAPGLLSVGTSSP
jgi:hypothetical protein